MRQPGFDLLVGSGRALTQRRLIVHQKAAAAATKRPELMQSQLRLLWIGFIATMLVLAQTMIARAQPESLAELAEQTSPSVVNITTTPVVEGRTEQPGGGPAG